MNLVAENMPKDRNIVKRELGGGGRRRGIIIIAA
jgi:hypothetical protein